MLHKAMLFIPAIRHKASSCHGLSKELAEATPSPWSMIQTVIFPSPLPQKAHPNPFHFLVFKVADSFLALTNWFTVQGLQTAWRGEKSWDRYSCSSQLRLTVAIGICIVIHYLVAGPIRTWLKKKKSPNPCHLLRRLRSSIFNLRMHSLFRTKEPSGNTV